ncbi:class I SAM-dependent methyltransferase [Haloterrigena alkaliphila]|uniref:Methyltransferase domain-containing protein n=1 Tax=Haloterrigena alkaliphila TaxID=2816475 RepID=A0A8A2VB91_9EURY|nr:class I SAM-dependent methyltransferase [Haloterrigena alkaliphila]QSW98751.1 methyltransferase domain-containing protein [Haloterrigena alkaliphila]
MTGEPTQDTDDPQSFYDEYAEREWDRLEGRIDGELELSGTVDVLEDHLPSSGRVLDAGGGAGRYSIWLAEQGYDVTMVDLSRGQLAVARDRLRERGVESRVTLVQGSITDIGLSADAFDATCCLGGPLSHVLSEPDRERAVRELRRVSRPDSPVIVSVMGLLGAVQLYLVTGHNLEALPDLLEHGDYTSALLERYGYENEFTATHFFRRAELESLLSRNGLEVVTTAGLEGLASPLHDERLRTDLETVTEAELSALERTVRRTADDPVVADLSIHMLAVAEA